MDKKPDKPDKDIEKNEEFRKELDNIKKIRRENKAEANEVINDLRDIFQDAPKEDRKEILGEIAESKKSLKMIQSECSCAESMLILINMMVLSLKS